jgi:predicted CXXCH cytochrome family protein
MIPIGAYETAMKSHIRWSIVGCILGIVSLLSGQLGSAQQAALDITPSQAIDLLGRLAQVRSGQEFFKGAAYVGSAQCKACHERAFSEWQETWHSKMLRAPDKPPKVVGNFNTTVRFEGVDALAPGDSFTQPQRPKKKVHFDVITSEKDGKYSFTIQDNDRTQAHNDQTYDVVWVLGGNWEETYHVKIKDYLFPAPLRWSVKFGEWELGLFQPENWVTYVEGTDPPRATPRKPDDFLAASTFDSKKLQIPTIRASDAGCMGCHTTGAEFVRIESAPGSGLFHWQMTGGEPSIGCERCHGPGSKHVAEAEAAKNANIKLGATTIVHGLKDLSPRQQSQICAQCHGRMMHRNGEMAFPYRTVSVNERHFLPGDLDVADQVRMWSYSGVDTDLSDRVREWRHPDAPTANLTNETSYFWPNEWGKKSRPQWQDFSRSIHASKAGVSCSTCHAFHGKKRDYQLRMDRQELCTDCHNASGLAKQPNKEIYAGSPHAEDGVVCVDCHMPRLGQRLTKTQTHATPAWDVTLHASRAAMPSLKKGYDIRSSCHGCHVDPQRTQLPNGIIPSAISLDELDQKTTARQREICGKMQDVQARIDDAQKKLDAVFNPPSLAVDKLNQARDKLRLLARDGSQGMHNLTTAREYIQDANNRIDEACTVLGQVCKKPNPQDACR